LWSGLKVNGFKNVIRRNKGGIFASAICLVPVVTFAFSRPVALLLLLVILFAAVAKYDRSGGIYSTLFLLVLIVIAISALLIVGLAHVHRVISG
jgi:uncharacterized membrane protein YfhO